MLQVDGTIVIVGAAAEPLDLPTFAIISSKLCPLFVLAASAVLLCHAHPLLTLMYLGFQTAHPVC